MAAGKCFNKKTSYFKITCSSVDSIDNEGKFFLSHH